MPVINLDSFCGSLGYVNILSVESFMNERFIVTARYEHPDNFRVAGWQIIGTHNHNTVVVEFEDRDTADSDCSALNATPT